MAGADQVIQTILGNENTRVDFDLDNWITDFENGFLDYSKINDEYNKGYWGQGIAHRPRIKELNLEPDAQSNQGYRLIEFFPDRENKNESYMFFGTPSEIKIQVATFMNLGKMLKDKDFGSVYGMPTTRFYESKIVQHRPEVTLIFIENREDVAESYNQISAQLSFRLMNQDETTVTPQKALELATRINTVLGGATSYKWKKGRELWAYIDPTRGYHLQANAWSKQEAKDVFEKVLSIQTHVPGWDEHLKDWAKRDSMTNTPTIPPTDFIYGKPRRRPRKLPIGTVHFKRAELALEGLLNPIILVDLTGTKPSALVKG